MGDAALRNLERAWRGGDPLARQHLAEGYLRRGDARAVLDVFAEAPPATAGEAELHARALGLVLGSFQPLQRVDGLRAYGDLVGWCGPELRYGALWNHPRRELRVLDRLRGALLAGGLPLRGLSRVEVTKGQLCAYASANDDAMMRWVVDLDESPEAVSHVPLGVRWVRDWGSMERLEHTPGGALSLRDGVTLASLSGSVLELSSPRGPRTTGVEATRRYDLASSWRRVDPVGAASTSWEASCCGFLDPDVVLAGRAVVDLEHGEVAFAKEELDLWLVPRLDRLGGQLLGLVGGRLRRVELSPPTPLVPTTSRPVASAGRTLPPAGGWWHPHANVAAVANPSGSWVGVPDRRPGLRFPLGTAPLGWTPAGELLVARGGGDAVALELWGAP